MSHVSHVLLHFARMCVACMLRACCTYVITFVMHAACTLRMHCTYFVCVRCVHVVLSHNYMGHSSIGHTCIGHNYVCLYVHRKGGARRFLAGGMVCAVPRYSRMLGVLLSLPSHGGHIARWPYCTVAILHGCRAAWWPYRTLAILRSSHRAVSSGNRQEGWPPTMTRTGRLLATFGACRRRRGRR